jgi:hypothetical protein
VLRIVASVAAGLVALGACSSNHGGSGARSTVDADRTAIVSLFQGANQAWREGRGAGIRYEVAHTYRFPGYANITVERASRCLAPELRLSYRLDQKSVRLSPGWAFPPARAVPKGRIYAFDVVETARGLPRGSAQMRIRVHATVMTDGGAKEFFGVTCSSAAGAVAANVAS